MVATRANGWEPFKTDQSISHVIPEIAIWASNIIDFHDRHLLHSFRWNGFQFFLGDKILQFYSVKNFVVCLIQF